MENSTIGLVAFGEVGTGKSTLCNTLIGSMVLHLLKVKEQNLKHLKQ